MDDKKPISAWTHIQDARKEVLSSSRLIFIRDIACIGRIVPDNGNAKRNKLKFYQ